MKMKLDRLIKIATVCSILSACGGAGTTTNSGQADTATRLVTGTIAPDASTPSANAPLGAIKNLAATSDAVCTLDQSIAVRAVPAQGEVIDSVLDETNSFTLTLPIDTAYSILFFQNDLLCGYLLNSQSLQASVLGTDSQDFDFGTISLTTDGLFIPEFDSEDFCDSDSDGVVDSQDTDVDGNGIEDETEDSDSDGIVDSRDCDNNNDGEFNSGVEDSVDETQDDSNDSSDDTGDTGSDSNSDGNDDEFSSDTGDSGSDSDTEESSGEDTSSNSNGGGSDGDLQDDNLN